MASSAPTPRPSSGLMVTLRRLPGRVLPDWLWFPVKRQLRKVFPAPPPPPKAAKSGAAAKAAPPKPRVNRTALASVDKRKGHIEGNTQFWKSAHEIPWGEVETRLFELAALNRPELIEDFVAKALELSAGRNEMTLSMLARSALAQDSLRRVLKRQYYAPTGDLAERMLKSQRFTGNFAAAAFHVLSPDEAQPVADLIRTVYPRMHPAYFELLDSHGLNPTAAQDAVSGTIPACQTRQPAEHRLIVADSLQDPARLSLLFAGARKVTIFSPGDLYGKVAIPDTLRLHFRPEDLAVAHPRSRITRFSARYHALHDETWRAAEQIIDTLESETGQFLGEGRLHAALHLADTLFFMAIKVAATEDMITATDFDQVVIASTGAVDPAEFLGSLTAGLDLAADPRIEFACLATTAEPRLSYAKSLHLVLSPDMAMTLVDPAPGQTARPLVSLLDSVQRATAKRIAGSRTFAPRTEDAAADDGAEVADEVETVEGADEARTAEGVADMETAERAAEPMAADDRDDSAAPADDQATHTPAIAAPTALRAQTGAMSANRKRVLFITTTAGSYNPSSAEYLDILSREYDTLTGYLGATVASFLKSLPETVPAPPENRIQHIRAEAHTDYPALAYALRSVLFRCGASMTRDGAARFTAHVLRKHAATVVERSLHPVYAHWVFITQWLQHLKDNDSLPDLLVAAPLRPALVGLAAAAGRPFGVPSMALETHGLTPTYCRYSRVMTDRYGVITHVFRDEAVAGFSIPADRVDVIGSPRLRLPADYDPAQAMRRARLVVADNSNIRFQRAKTYAAFFSQPSNWEQISQVWSIILESMRSLPDLELLLKLHPEEGPTRADSFMELAQRADLADRVHLLSCNAVEAIEAADLALSCYSATVVEAAMLSKPVFCVINGDNEYPLNQHDVVGAPLFRYAEHLTPALAAFCQNPEPFNARAQEFLKREPQIVSGPDQPLLDAVAAMLARPAKDNIRLPQDLPPRLFLEGPFRVYDI